MLLGLLLALLGAIGLAPTRFRAAAPAPSVLTPTPTVTCGPAWRTVASPNPGALHAISAFSPTDIWAVGSYYTATPSGSAEQTLTLHWNGSNWAVVPSPNASTFNNILTGVTVVAPNDAWAVGSYNTPLGVVFTLVMHWNGTQWSLVTHPDPAHNGSQVLHDVTARAANDVWAVGEWDAGITQVLIEHWNGSAWDIVEADQVGVLYGVSVVSAANVWAVGTRYGVTLVLRWNGTSWAVVPSPNGSPDGNLLIDATVTTANDIWAVGYQYTNGQPTQTLAEHWDGTAWTIVLGPLVDPTGAVLQAVDAVASNDIWAVGSHGNQQPLVEHWDGQGWQAVPAENGGSTLSQLGAVAALGSADVWAVGWLWNNGLQPLVEHYSPGGCPIPPSYTPPPTATPTFTRTPTVTPMPLLSPTPGCVPDWAVISSPSPDNFRNFLLGATALAPANAWAVGYIGNGLTLAEHWDGAFWTTVTSPNPSYGGHLNAVAATRATDVWAVGAGVNTYHTLTEHWDGTAWSIVPSPNPGSFYNFLEGVAAIGPQDVWATGFYKILGNRTLLLHWDGSTWSQVSSPNMGGNGDDNYLHAIAATANNDVWAVGHVNDIQSQELILHWNGTSWQIVTGLTAPNSRLYRVAPRTATDAWAVGIGDSTSSARALILHWDGTGWTQMPLALDATLYAVAATAANNAWAVGALGPMDARQSVILHWDGISWTRMTSPNPEPVHDNVLYSVATAGSSVVWAVGYYGRSLSGTQSHTLVEQYTPLCPTVTPAPSPTGGVPSPTRTTTPGTPPPSPTGGLPSPTRTAPAVPTVTAGLTGTPGVPSATPIPSPTAAVPTATPCLLQFTDVPPGSTFYPYVRCLACQGIVSGYACGGPGEPCPGSYFRPNNQVTRGQVSKIVAESAGFSELMPSTQQTFEDVTPASTFWRWVERLAGRGIIGGYPCGGPFEPCVAPTNRPYFRPNNNVTRGQLSKITSGAAGWTETPTAQTFEDSPPTSPFYRWIERVAARGIVNGYPCGGAGEPCVAPDNRPYFRPANNATRGQMSKIAAAAFFPGCTTPSRR
jgi:hypothetical protein